MRPPRSRPRAPALLFVLLGIAGASCTSRTLPLPPPEVTSVSRPNAQGRVTVSGIALESASIGIVNDRTLEGVIVTSPAADCHSACEFEAELAAEPGDVLRVWQFFETAGAKEAFVPPP